VSGSSSDSGSRLEVSGSSSDSGSRLEVSGSSSDSGSRPGLSGSSSGGGSRAGGAGPPVVVVGAGPVGQTTALLLARWGVPSVVLERAPAREVVGSRAICQQRDVLDVWAAVGVGEQIAAEGVTWRTARTYLGDRELFAVQFADSGRSPFPPWVNISQSRVEQLLDERVAGDPLVEVRWGAEVTRIDSSDDGVVVHAATADGPVAVRAAYAVVCAGLRTGGLREALGVDLAGRSFEDRFLICDIRADLPDWELERRFFFDPVWNPGRQVLIHPCPDRVYRIDWQVPPDFDLDAEEATGGLDRRIRQIVGEEASYEVVWRSVYRFASRVADRFRVGRVLLAGDAAHVFAPFGARGLNSGVQDAENAAWKLAFVLRGWAPEALLGTYEVERRAAALENLAVTTATMRFLVPGSSEERARREAALRAARTDPAAASGVDSGRLAEPFWYAESPLTTPDATRPAPTRPDRGSTQPPAPGVLVPDLPLEPEGRLRGVARDGLLALVADDVDPAEVAGALAGAVQAPTAVRRVGEIAAEAVGVLGHRGGEVWLLRPDGHLAAILDDPSEVPTAARRALGWCLEEAA
jgi:3-(3-hydroxy-phenyl)propionate hydroxylase